MGNNISLEENDNEHQNIQSDIEMKSVSSDESGAAVGENSNNDVPHTHTMTNVKKSKKISNDALKKRRSTSKNSNASAFKKTKSARRR
jgi:hypothetical protein